MRDQATDSLIVRYSERLRRYAAVDSTGNIVYITAEGVSAAVSATGTVTEIVSPRVVHPSVVAESQAILCLQNALLLGNEQIKEIRLLYDVYGLPFGPIRVGESLTFEFDKDSKLIDVWPERGGRP